MSGVNNFPDGVVQNPQLPPGDAIPNPKAPEENYPQQMGEDLTWVAGIGGAHGYQPITSTNPDGDYYGISPMSPGMGDMLAAPDIAASAMNN